MTRYSAPRARRLSHEPGSHPFALIAAWAIVFIGSFTPGAPWTAHHGLMLGLAGALMLIAPAAVRISRLWLACAALVLLFGAASFLPAHWFPVPAWRTELEALGVDTGPHVVIQARQALEVYGLYAGMLIFGLWLVGHRASERQLHDIALCFVLGVAVYAIAAELLRGQLTVARGNLTHFGFFPNRNQTGTYLAMGSICGLGVAFQALRDRHFWRMGFALLATGICMWAVFAWSISRGGVIMLSAGTVIWLLCLGPRYLGKHGRKAIALAALLAIGVFVLNETQVKTRLSDTRERIAALEFAAADDLVPAPALNEQIDGLDLRVPIMKDAWKMTLAAPLTGFGAGQFVHVFPQYRYLSTIPSTNSNIHPESDWLWWATELGLPATGVLLAGTGMALFLSFRRLKEGRDRCLRGACLAAAAIFTINGFFDVPGHRLPLLWAAVLLFTLSLPSGSFKTVPSPVRWLTTPLAASLVGLSLFWFRPQSFGHFETRAPWPPAGLAATAAKTKEYNQIPFTRPLEKQNKYEQALASAREVAEIHPLNSWAWYQFGALSLRDPSTHPMAERAFRLQRVLAPDQMGPLLYQAQLWGPYDPERMLQLWEEAVQLTSKMERRPQSYGFSTQRTVSRFRQQVAKSPLLKRYVQNRKVDFLIENK